MLRICSALARDTSESSSFLKVDPRKKQITLYDPLACGGQNAFPKRGSQVPPKMFAFDAVFPQDASQVGTAPGPGRVRVFQGAWTHSPGPVSGRVVPGARCRAGSSSTHGASPRISPFCGTSGAIPRAGPGRQDSNKIDPWGEGGASQSWVPSRSRATVDRIGSFRTTTWGSWQLVMRTPLPPLFWVWVCKGKKCFRELG